MKKCDCEHWETCMICYPQGFDAQGKRKPVEVPPSREELQAKVAELTKERDEAQIVGDKLFAKLTRAEAVIEKASVALSSCDVNDRDFPLDTQFYDSALVDVGLAAITEYKEGK